MQIPRGAALLVILIGGLVVAYGMLSERQASEQRETPARTATVRSYQPIADADAPRVLSTELPIISMPPHPAIGRTVHVRNEWPRRGSGTQEDPYRDLESALCSLQPGDRLIVWPGRYIGPISIDGDCVDGTPEKPIEVVLASGALFFGKEGVEVPIDSPLLAVRRSSWHFIELELEPHWMRPAMLIGPDVSDIQVIGAHILKGVGHGVEISDGVSNVLVQGSHLHHLGTLRGAKRNFRDPEAAGVSVAGSAVGIDLSELVIHHLEGEAVRVWSAQGGEATERELQARNISQTGIQATALLGLWD